MPCLIKPDMHQYLIVHHAMIMLVCLPCCLLLSGLLLSLASVSFQSCEDLFDYVRLSSSWTRSSSLRDLRQDDHTLEITTIFAMLVCSLFCYANATMPTFCLSASQIAMSASDFFTLPSKLLFGYVTTFCSAPLIVVSCR